MVRGFVQKEKIRRAHQGASERQAVAPAAGETFDVTNVVRGQETQAAENRLCLRTNRPFVHFRQLRQSRGFAHGVARRLRGSKFRLGRHERRVTA